MIAHGGSGRIFSLHAYAALHNCLGPVITPHIQRTCLAISTYFSDMLSWGCQGSSLPWVTLSVHVAFFSFKCCRNTEPNSANSHSHSFQLSVMSAGLPMTYWVGLLPNIFCKLPQKDYICETQVIQDT